LGGGSGFGQVQVGDGRWGEGVVGFVRGEGGHCGL